MLLANSVILTFAKDVPELGTKVVAIGGLLLCGAWIVISWIGWSIYGDYLKEAAKFDWSTLSKNGKSINPVEIIGKRYLKLDWIKVSAFVVIVLFMVGYLVLLFGETPPPP
jgi:Na+/proline symporter